MLVRLGKVDVGERRSLDGAKILRGFPRGQPFAFPLDARETSPVRVRLGPEERLPPGPFVVGLLLSAAHPVRFLLREKILRPGREILSGVVRAVIAGLGDIFGVQPGLALRGGLGGGWRGFASRIVRVGAACLGRGLE